MDLIGNQSVDMHLSYNETIKTLNNFIKEFDNYCISSVNLKLMFSKTASRLMQADREIASCSNRWSIDWKLFMVAKVLTLANDILKHSI